MNKPERSSQATASLGLGILSLTCFGLFSGIPAIVLGKSAIRKIKTSDGILTGSGLAWAGIITGWIGTLLSLGFILFVAHLLRTEAGFQRRRSPITTCVNNLRQIDGAKQQWALETKAEATATPAWENIQHYLGRGASGEIPKCPVGGSYTINNLRTAPSCSIQGHAIN